MTAAPSITNRSRATNGKSLFAEGGDMRGRWARRLRDLIWLYATDLGGADGLTEAERSLIRRAGVLTVELERLEARFSVSEPTPDDIDRYQRAAGNLRRLLETVGIQRRPRNVTPPSGPTWAACTLDGWSDQHGCPVEAKHVGGREPLEVVTDRYQPQMQWQMIVTGASQCAFSVIVAANEPVVDFIPRDDDYARELWTRAEAFMDCVRTLTPPVALAPVIPVIPVITYDMAGNNQWASEAVTWQTTRQAKRDCDAAEKALKGLVPADAVRCHGYGIEIKRDRAGRLSIKELK